jgi:uncharacterized protein YkwD
MNNGPMIFIYRTSRVMGEWLWYGCCITTINISMKYILGSLCFIMLLSCSPAVAPSSSVPGTVVRNEPPGNMEGNILGYINDYRRSRGLAALQMTDIASRQAAQHSRNMASGKTAFSHDGFDQRIAAIKKAMGADYMAAAAENVASGQMSAKEVVNGWLKSAGHKKNIEGNYNLTGIGVAQSSKGELYFTQIFLRK